MPALKTHPECTIHKDKIRPLWLDEKNDDVYAKISPNMVYPRDLARNTKEQEVHPAWLKDWKYLMDMAKQGIEPEQYHSGRKSFEEM